jgi:dCTP diphosphatase
MNNKTNEAFADIKKRLKTFAAKRDWDKFHAPKNLVMALSSEMGELTEHFQWLSEDQSKDIPSPALEKIKEEIADVQIYLIRLADKLDIDILDSVESKMAKNERKYPADLVFGSAKKYTEYKTKDDQGR